MRKEERNSLLREGYVEGMGESPMIISLTTTIASLAVTQLFHLLTGFRGDLGNIACLRYDILEGTVRRGTAMVKPNCVCGKHLGFGDLRPLDTVEDERFVSECRKK
jgi:hypothetical protein